MTEADWLSGRDCYAMLRYLHFLRCARRGRPTDPKVRLLACHCCEVVRHLLHFEGSRQAFQAVAAYARGHVAELELASAVPFAEAGLNAAEAAWRAAWGEPATRHARAVAWAAEAVLYALGARADRPLSTCNWKAGTAGQVVWAVECALICAASPSGLAAGQAERRRRLWLFHELFGNPFRPIAFVPAWRTEAVLVLARAANQDGEFDVLPVLGDALEEAGCTDAQLLGHCRSSEPHARGCWALDLVLGIDT